MLDGGIAALFGEAFAGLYLDGQLHAGLTGPVYDAGGAITGYSGGGSIAIKVQTDAATWSMQRQDGFAEGDVALLVLAQGIGTIGTDHEITDGRGQRYKVKSADLDAAASHWTIRGRAA